MTPKTILLTGATGYLGSHLLKFWLAKGHHLVVLKRSTSSLRRVAGYVKKCTWYNVDFPDWVQAFEKHQIDTVVHVAASYGRKGETIAQIVDSNTIFPLKLLDLAIANGVKQFINTASSLPRNLNAYALSKAQFSDWLGFKKNEIGGINLVIEYFYGTEDDDWKFINMVINRLLNDEPFIDFTKGNQKRDFIYITDVVSAFDIVLNKYHLLGNEFSIPVGSGNSYTLREVVELCKVISNNSATRLNFGALPDRPGEVAELIADTSLMESLGWRCQYTLKEGLFELINNR
ncbi:Nucleoside-diphosphate-sugar epimerase [Cyclobacterium xiamenense]|uniref:Nucleoside-diphosphate-sugar epimerase n=1 Tax=Cyclobacterium xiamenense TaxID=1297121 RepID=A0A1H6ZAR7_9BACT|nr:NAD(P)-dependent oxidoreductase [Cyclobacterium xiamenense]SEJ50653.1 Nucleoside-diphosphate-sugar epimerase [Cyclobacterium xiamenense]